jgi:hypothetical protein
MGKVDESAVDQGAVKAKDLPNVDDETRNRGYWEQE